MHSPSAKTADKPFTVAQVPNTDEFVLVDAFGAPIGRVKQPFITVIDGMTTTGQANVVQALSEFSNRHYPVETIRSLLMCDRERCPQCESPRPITFFAEQTDFDPETGECPVCGVKQGEMKEEEERLTSFDVCVRCLASNNDPITSIDGAPSMSLSFSRKQGLYWWKPGCAYFTVKRNKDDKWGPCSTCPFYTEHAVINKPMYLFPFHDTYWMIYRMAMRGKVFVSNTGNNYSLIFADPGNPTKNVDIDRVINRVVPRNLRYHTTTSTRVIMARALSVERLGTMSKMVREKKSYAYMAKRKKQNDNSNAG